MLQQDFGVIADCKLAFGSFVAFVGSVGSWFTRGSVSAILPIQVLENFSSYF